MNVVAEWKTAVRAQLTQLGEVFEQRFGYPLDENSDFVSDANQETLAGVSEAAFPPALAEFYAEVGEVSLPDVNNGYFIHPADRLLVAADWGLPVRVDVGEIGDVATFGSDGGGGFFCMSSRSGIIYHLPPGELVDGVYSGGLGGTQVVGENLESFLQRLLVVIREFVTQGTAAEL